MAEVAKDEMDLIKDMVAKGGFETPGKHTFNNGVITVVDPPPAAATPVVEPPVAVTPPVADPAKEPIATTPPAAEPAKEPVVADKEIIEVPKEPVVTPPVEIDYNKILEESSNGSIKSKEELTNLIEDYNKQKEFLGSDTYQFATKLAAWEKEGLPTELFTPIQSLTADEIGEMPADELAKLDIKFQHPTWTEEDVNLYFNEEYKQDKEKHDDNTVRFGTLRMRENADKFRGRLGELKELSHVPTSESRIAETRQAEDLRRSTWKQNVPKFIEDFNKITVPVDEKGGTIDFIPTKDQKAELQREIEQIVQSAPVQFDEQGIKAAKAIMLEKFISKNVNQISKAIAQKVSSNKDAEYLKKITNPTGANPEPVNAPPVKKERSIDDAMAAIMESEGLRNIRR